jgi:hypothetical protein
VAIQLFFNDLNSLHLYVNASKSLPIFRAFREIGSEELLSNICNMGSELEFCERTATDKWIESSVLGKLVGIWNRSEEQSEPLRTLLKTVLLLSIRDFSSFIRTENPTWLKPGGLRSNVSVEQEFRSAIDRLAAYYQHAYLNKDIKACFNRIV